MDGDSRVASQTGKLLMMCCKVLITTDSCHVHREVARTMPILRRYSRAKLNADQVQTMGKVLDTYTESVCRPISRRLS